MGALVLSADANPGTASWQTPLVVALAPASGSAIPVDNSYTFSLNILAAGETNTLAAPTFAGQLLALYANSVAGGASRVVSVAQPIDQAGNNTITLSTVADFILLMSVAGGGWRLLRNDGCTLSIV